jgi:hypothetical protein
VYGHIWWQKYLHDSYGFNKALPNKREKEIENQMAKYQEYHRPAVALRMRSRAASCAQLTLWLRKRLLRRPNRGHAFKSYEERRFPRRKPKS